MRLHWPPFFSFFSSSSFFFFSCRYYCPEGSSVAREIKCGDPSFYCPQGSPEPLVVPQGYYSTGGDWLTRTSIAYASKGYYALHGILKACPPGTYGAGEVREENELTGIINRSIDRT